MRLFAGDADIQLIAEGIETKPQLATLRDLDIELGQGFLLGRPRPVGSVADPGTRHSRKGQNGV
jgi:EAL domain-containing protein (putative c-di-GMP-specific phosphodiesterase class I)